MYSSSLSLTIQWTVIRHFVSRVLSFDMAFTFSSLHLALSLRQRGPYDAFSHQERIDGGGELMEAGTLSLSLSVFSIHGHDINSGTWY